MRTMRLIETRAELVIGRVGTAAVETTTPRAAIECDREPQPGDTITDNGDGTWTLGDLQRPGEKVIELKSGKDIRGAGFR